MSLQEELVLRKEVRVSKWYFGGFSSAGAACVTHPLDLLKVQMQTQKGKNISMFQLVGIVIRNEGKHIETSIILANKKLMNNSELNLKFIQVN